jgi:predicted RNase H-like HicB family nuclease
LSVIAKQVKRLIREAAEMHLQAMREDAAPIPEPSTLTDYITVA